MAAFEMLRRMGALGGIADPFPEFVAFSAGLAALDGRALVRDGKLWGARTIRGSGNTCASPPNSRSSMATARAAPCFNPDGTLDTIYWARPQFDGPALRAMLLTARAIDAVSGPQEHALLIGDLDYLARVCHEPCFDLWEERFGHHYHTRLVMLAALEGGATWRAGRGETAAAMLYQRVAKELRAALDTHWSAAMVFSLAASRAGDATPRDLDAAVILAVAQARIRSGPHSVLDPRAQATLLKLEELFEFELRDQPRAPGRSWRSAWAFSRRRLLRRRRLSVHDLRGGCLSLSHRRRLARRLGAGAARGKRTFSGVVRRRAGRARVAKFIARGDAILAALRRFTPPDGRMAEQIDKETGAPASALDLPMEPRRFRARL